MEESARVVSLILKRLADQCVIGMTGKKLEAMAESMLKEYGAESFNKDYQPAWATVPYPSILCISPNGVIFHGIPNDYEFKNGDLITIDLGIKKDGFCGDAALTVPVGEISHTNKRLLYYARQAVYEYARQLVTGANTRDLANHIDTWAINRGFYLNRRGAGHVIGEQMHIKPNLYNTVEDDNHTYANLEEGMIVCIEPTLSTSKDRIGAVLSDGWSVVTMDGKPTAMFEHMVRVTKNGGEILTSHFDDSKSE